MYRTVPKFTRSAGWTRFDAFKTDENGYMIHLFKLNDLNLKR